ncbi:C40 family peptidase [Dysgonomonas sp. 511]|uniref:C40 family peptidase n=1 Tax=Dysgonomonas sp. 511 TaxID=2302930 RepID=UPI0013D8338D|nr:C40 family peptidase [Dysgonomonas sp. 511]NDV78501.1 hypothetical protein [Dysgonomonas sp. 511]
MTRATFSFLAISILLITSCAKKQEKHVLDLKQLVNQVQDKYIADKRVKVYDVQIKDSITTILRGETSDEQAYNELIERSKEIYPAIVNELRLLPSEDLQGKTYGVVKLSVADIREKPDFTSGMATQAILGTPIRILQQDGWYRIQTPDGYIGWTQDANFHAMTKDEFNTWVEAPKVIFTDYFGFAYKDADKNSQTISDLVEGNILKWEGEKGLFYKVSYPDGKEAYVSKSQAMPYDRWRSSLQLTGESLVKKSLTMMGIPYVWGGASVKGMDCSGYTKQVLFMHGIILMRDASQQVNTGIPVDISDGYDNLRPGDLLFFGKKATETAKQRIRHVGFYIGNHEFIHASGCIRISSLDKDKPNYDERNATELVSARRMVGAADTEGVWTIANNPLYKTQD